MLSIPTNVFEVKHKTVWINVHENEIHDMCFVAASKAYLSLESTLLKVNSLSRDVLL